MASITNESVNEEKPVEKKESGKSSKYRCITKCYWQGQLFYEGQVIESDAKDVPVHFEKLK